MPETPTDEPTRVEPAGPAAGASEGPISVIKVSGQAFAAVTAAGVGAALGGAGGTVAGAGIAAVVTTVGEAVYQRSLERTRDHVRTRIRSRRPDRSGGSDAVQAQGALDGPTVVLGGAGGPDGRDGVATRVVEAPGRDDPDGDSPPPARPWKRYGVLVATGLLIFLIALLAITGIERVKGSPISGGQSGTSVGSVLGGGRTTTTTAATTSATSTEDSAPTSTAPEATDGATTTTGTRSRATTTTEAPGLVPTGLLPGN